MTPFIRFQMRNDSAAPGLSSILTFPTTDEVRVFPDTMSQQNAAMALNSFSVTGAVT